MDPPKKADFDTNPAYKFVSVIILIKKNYFRLTDEEIEEWKAAGKIGNSPSAGERARERFAKGDDVSWSKAGRANYLNAAERLALAQFILSRRLAQRGLTYHEVLQKVLLNLVLVVFNFFFF
jgi:hypothetical protein